MRKIMPKGTEALLKRPRLLDKIALPGTQLTYIHADAGYGKTTLLMQYAKGRDDVVWMALDEKDRELLFFLQHLESSLRERLVGFEFHATDYIPFTGSATFVSVVLSALLKAIGSNTLTIILDDMHLITNQQLIELLSEMVKGCPPQITLIMASRHELWSGLFRLKMAGGVTELTKKDLSFNQEEATRLWGFFDEAAYSATEGWTLAIQSYRLATEGNNELSLAKLEAERDISRYLFNEIFMGLTEEFQDFLKATSRLPELEVVTCNHLLDIDHAQKILEELVHRNLFTLRTSDTTYRYHTLFRSFLQHNDEGHGWRILQKAKERYYVSGDYGRAVEYAFLVEDGRIIQNCISAMAGEIIAQGCSRDLKRYFDFLQVRHVELTPRVQLIKGIYLSDRGDFYQAEKYLRVAMPQLISEEKYLYILAMTHSARVLRNRASFAESNACLDSLLPLLEGAPMTAWYGVVIEKIHNLTLMSQLFEAMDLTMAMMNKCLVNGDLRIKGWFERYLTVIYFYKGDYKNCLKAYEKSLAIPQEEQDQLMRHGVGVYAAKAYQIVGQEEKALLLLNTELYRMRQLGLHEEFSINYLLYAETLNTAEQLKYYLGEATDFSVSDRYLNMAEEYAILNRSTREHWLFVKIWKACAEILEHRDKTEQIIAEIHMLIEDTTPFFQTVAYGRMANALQVLRKDKEQYIEYYKKSITIGERIGCYAYATLAYGKLAAIYLAEGDEKQAQNYTRRFLELSRQYDHRYYMRFKPLFATVLKQAADAGIMPEYTRELLNYGGYISARVYINTLGTFYMAPAYERKSPIKIRTQKARELLAYLLEHRKGVSKENIFNDLWWDSEANVTSLFHTRRGEIRRAFESVGAGNPIVYERGLYHLKMAEISCDLDAFQQAATAFVQQPSFGNAQKVVEHYTGRYLNDLEALWAESSRLRLEELFLSAAAVLQEGYAESGEKSKARELTRRCAKMGHSIASSEN
ncbi:MAG: AAA family ATPase [Desulfitobacterium sp.]